MSEPDLTPKSATPATTARNREAARAPYLADQGDVERARRGLVARPSSPQVLHDGGWPVWDLDAFTFLDGDAPAEANPALWRQGRLNNEAGLFEVAPGFWQVRGLDLANLTVIAGDTGWIVIDPLTSVQTARAAMALVNQTLGERPVSALIYTHSHIDHFGGVRGVIDEAEVLAGRLPVIAPSGFLEAAVSENVVAGNAMTRRATYMYGALLPKGPRGHLDAGLGKGVPLLAEQGLIAPTVEIETTGTELVVDGIRIVFQVTPDTEAPSEMNFHFPDHRVLCLAENCTCTMHNLYTLRGAQVRDSLSWSKYLQEAIDLYGEDTDVCFASHHWPRWGAEEILRHLAHQRDLYRYLHDQTLRLANHGLTGPEIAEQLQLPDSLEQDPASRGYYGTVNHNVKAVYQRYVAFMGGAEAVLDKARTSFEEGDYRWVAEVVNHVVFADETNLEAKALQADALEQLGYQAESGPWRDFYLTGAQELRTGTMTGLPGSGPGPDTVAAMTTELLFDYLGVRIDGLAAADRRWRLRVQVTDRVEDWRLGVHHGALHTAPVAPGSDPEVEATVRGAHAAVAALVFGAQTLDELEATGAISVDGDRDAVVALLDVLDSFTLFFPIVTP